MRAFMITRRDRYVDQLAELEKRTSIYYSDEMLKAGLKAKISFIEEVLAAEGDVFKEPTLYRVELVDFIDASSEHEAIVCFVQAIQSIDLSDEAFDVYEVDPRTRKAVK